MLRSERRFPNPSRLTRSVAWVLLTLSLAGCDALRSWLEDEQKQPTAAEPTYPVLVIARRDDQDTVPEVQLLLGGKVAGTTGPQGSVQLALKGAEGDLIALTVKCPETYASPEKPIVVGLRRMASGSPPPKFEVQCVPLVRQIVVGIRTENGANLPIRRLNQVVGQTDASGVAHLLLQASPREPVTLTLDTRGDDTLRPQSPTLTFSAPDRDELILLEQKFTVKKKVVHVAPKLIPKPL